MKPIEIGGGRFEESESGRKGDTFFFVGTMTTNQRVAVYVAWLEA